MNRIISNFLKDKFSITLIYFINTFIILLFFYLYVDKTIPLMYPILLSIFIYMIFLSFEFYRYYKFNISIIKTGKNANVDIYAKTCEQREVKETICTINNRYIYDINSMKEENKINNKFFSQWVHNMKTPVSIIEIIIQKLTEKLEPKSSVNDLVEEIREENNKLLNGLDQILNMIRIEDFSKDYVPETVDLYDSLKNIINDRKCQFIYNNVFPKVLCDCEDEKVLTDGKWNEVMLSQIISNAIKYSRACDEDKSSNKFLFFNMKKDKQYIILTIRDEGIGIPSYDIDRAFEAFFTGENGRKYKYSTGIGLYICKVICEKLGHDISIESEVGQGTEVTIRYLSKL